MGSEVALCWIKGKKKCCWSWVENLVVKIRKAVERQRWFHVSGVLNPADVTRVCSREFIDEWFDVPEVFHSDRFETIKFDFSSWLWMVKKMVHSEIKLRSFRDAGNAKSVRRNELAVNLPNKYLFKINAEEGKTLGVVHMR